GLLFPQLGRALLELAHGVLGGFVHRETGGEGGAAAAGYVGMADRIGVDDHAGGAVGVDIDHRRGLEADVEPEARGDAATAVFALQLGLVVRAVLDRLDRLDKSDALVRRPRGLRRAFLGAIHDPYVARVDAALLRELVDYRLRSERRVGRARRAIGRGLGPVNDHVVSVDHQVGDIVWRHDT